MKKVKLIVLMLIMVLGLTGCGKTNLEETKKDLNEIPEEYGYVEKETVDVLVSKFNKEVVDNSSLNPASTDYLTENNNQYWYGLIEGIYLVVIPEKYTGDKTTEIVDYMLLYVEKFNKYESDVIPYTKYLIKANNSKIADDEINILLDEARAKSESGKTSNNGKGISVGYLDQEKSYQYQVLRIYK